MCPTLLIRYGSITVSRKMSLWTVSRCHTLDKKGGSTEILSLCCLHGSCKKCCEKLGNEVISGVELSGTSSPKDPVLTHYLHPIQSSGSRSLRIIQLHNRAREPIFTCWGWLKLLLLLLFLEYKTWKRITLFFLENEAACTRYSVLQDPCWGFLEKSHRLFVLGNLSLLPFGEICV